MPGYFRGDASDMEFLGVFSEHYNQGGNKTLALVINSFALFGKKKNLPTIRKLYEGSEKNYTSIGVLISSSDMIGTTCQRDYSRLSN